MRRPETCTGAKALFTGAVAAVTALTAVVSAGAAQAKAPARCVPNVNDSGLSAAVVARAGQTIANRVVATTCDIGIFVGPHASHVTIRHVTVSGAGFQGVLAENTSYVTVRNSTIRGNGLRTIDAKAPVQPGSGLHSFVGQSFGISLFGVNHAAIRDNTVTGNGRGGIGVMDNGANNPGTITQDTSAPLVSSSHVTITGNKLSANYNGCAIVAATQNLGGRVSHLLISDNTIRGTGMSKQGPDVGGIVVAANLPNSSVHDALVSDNRVGKSFEGGVIVNAEAPGSSTDNVIVTGNTLHANNWGKQEAPRTAGVVLFAAPGTTAANSGTVVAGNVITDQYYGIWSQGANSTSVFANRIRVTAHGVAISHS